jgi:hypothetical protein
MKVKFSYDDRNIEMKYSDLTTRAVITSDVHLDFFSNADNQDAISVEPLQDDQGNMHIGLVAAEYAKLCSEKNLTRDGDGFFSDIVHLANLLKAKYVEEFTSNEVQWKAIGDKLTRMDKASGTLASQSATLQFRLYRSISSHLGDDNVWTYTKKTGNNEKGTIKFNPSKSFMDTVKKYWQTNDGTIKSACKIANPCFEPLWEKAKDGYLATPITTVASKIYSSAKGLSDDIQEQKSAFTEMVSCMSKLPGTDCKDKDAAYDDFETSLDNSQYWQNVSLPPDWQESKEAKTRLIAGCLTPIPDIPVDDTTDDSITSVSIDIPVIDIDNINGDFDDVLSQCRLTVIALTKHVETLNDSIEQLVERKSISAETEQFNNLKALLPDLSDDEISVMVNKQNAAKQSGIAQSKALESGDNVETNADG